MCSSDLPSYDAVAHLPFPQLLEQLRDPVLRTAILSEKANKNAFEGTTMRYDLMFQLEQADGSLDYEPKLAASLQERAKATGENEEDIVYDMMMANEGCGYVFVILVNYGDYNLDFVYELMNDPTVLVGGSDAGAHCGAICDAAMPTFLLSYWTRDRTHGPKLSLEHAVEKQTRDTARFYGFNDRGVLAPGMKADVNVIDYENLNISRPNMVADLPAGGKRLLQTAKGYRNTIVSGVVTFEDGVATGALPGRLQRSAPNAFTPAQNLEMAG